MDIRKVIAEELHKPARRKYPRRHVTLKGMQDLYQADLVEMQPYSRQNKGFRYILTMINCFTKFAFAIPLKDKTMVEVVKALEPILAKNKMKHLQTDDGKEWFNKDVNALVEKYKINHYATFSELKASIVERFNRTLKERMWKLFTARGKYEWVSILQDIVNQYNSSVHRTTRMRPKDVRQKHVKDILARINKKRIPAKDTLVRNNRTTFSAKDILARNNQNKIYASKPKYKVADSVRISKYKRVFTKGYMPNWTNEVFKIHAVKPTDPVTYILRDSTGELLKGGFYEPELSKSKTGDVYLVEKVLRRKGDKVLVRWLGFDGKDDTWVDKSNILI